MKIIGISAFYHDSAAALIDDGVIIAAAQEERFSREKHDRNFPCNSIKYCLESSATTLDQIDYVVFYDKPFLKFERLLETYLSFAPRGFESFKTAMPVWLREKLFQKDLLRKHLCSFEKDFDWKNRLLFAEHHQSHAASAFFPSPYKDALVLTMEGVGEWATTSVAIGNSNKLSVIKELHFPHSLGLLYSAFTYYTGFKVNSGEYKVMGLAPYGEPKYTNLIFDNLIDLKEDGSFRLDQSFFDYCTGLKMTNTKFDQLFGGPPRKPDSLLSQRDMDLAASIQAVTEEVVLRMTRSLSQEFSLDNLCLAGGVALNCVANGKVLKDGRFKNIWIQPAAGDAGGALGAALCAYHHFKNGERTISGTGDQMRGSYLGPEFSNAEIEKRIKKLGGVLSRLPTDELIKQTAIAIAEGKAIGWFQGRMEFGPRALGNRSILGDPRSPTMQKTLNLKIKFRESFRPFAPSVLREDVCEWFEMDGDSPYMLLVAELLKNKRIPISEVDNGKFGMDKLNSVRSDIPAVTHVDYSARIQTIERRQNTIYHSLLSKFKEITGCPILANTSFNIRGEPIVCTPEDAFKCFMGTDLDVLAIGNFLLQKKQQPKNLALDYRRDFELD
ncbi:MAG: carbamoyltransferase [Pseudomonadota bacterium]|nr:carbamoyltransferase [Pseudomonadota bacterium]